MSFSYYGVGGENGFAGVRSIAARNEIIAQRMQAIDAQYFAYEAALVRERQEIGFVTSIINIGLAGAVPLVGPVATKNILGGASSALQGGTKTYSDEVLFQKTVQVLQMQMRANRDRIAADIFMKWKGSLDEYPLPIAIGDLEEYYSAGTIAGALVEVNKTVGEKAKDAEGLKVDALTVRFAPLTDLTRRIRTFARANPKRVRDWIDEFAQGVPLPTFLRSDNAALHRRIIQELSIP
jgi:hypothetical protein